MKVIGVSGSAIPNSNTDRAVKAVLKATGLETEFIKLSKFKIAPCTACLGCVETNICVIKDDAIALAEKVKEADALVIGGYTPYSSLDSRTKTFIERLYPLRHKHGYMAGKPGVGVVSCAIPVGNEMLPPAGDMGVNAIKYYMMEEGMNFLGAVRVVGNVPCIKCNAEGECTISGLKMVYGSTANADSVGINVFEDQPETIEMTQKLGKEIAKILLK